MGRNKRRQAYSRGYRDSLIDFNEFLRDLEQTIYRFQLIFEFNGCDDEEVQSKLLLLRQAIQEYRDEAFANGGFTSDSEIKTRVRTIMDLQKGNNNGIEESSGIIDLDDSVMEFIAKRSPDFEDED